LRARMITENALTRILKDPHLPTPAPIALRILEKARQPNCSVEEITETILLDPALSGKILKTVNSALFSMPRSITSLERAVSVLGTRAVRALAITLSLPAIQSRNRTCRQVKRYWTSSVLGA